MQKTLTRENRDSCGRFGLLILLACSPLAAQQPDRIQGSLEQGRTVLKGHVHAKARPEFDQGAVETWFEIGYMTLLMKPSQRQQADLDRLLAAQQDPASPQYHQWLAPEDYAARFGLSGRDTEKVTAWLRAQGFTVHDVARGRQWVTFSGTAGQVGRAFQTEIHRYQADGETHFANMAEPSVPTGLANVVGGIHGLNDFPWRSPRILPRPEFTNGSGNTIAPDDLAVIYNLNPLYKAGIDGTGQTIAVIGRTGVDLADIRSFRSAFGLPANDPKLMLFGSDPGIRNSDLAEADLDLEISGAVARNATVLYVYSKSVLTAAQYAVDQNLAPVMSLSYGICEPETSPSLRPVAQQANAQGITWLASSGDFGAADCDSATARQASRGLAVDFPGSMPELTSVGGTEFSEAGGNYWSGTNAAGGGSALSYIPEIAWNDSGSSGLSASGGGASVLFSKPTWQTGPGVPNDGARDVPDVALSASPQHDGYRIFTGGAIHVYGGTSASTPGFAGIVGLLNHYLVSNNRQSQAGLGNINPALYRLAQSTSDVFHDVTGGDNIVPCAQSSPNCSKGFMGYQAGPGYDQVTGLGSVDAYNLATRWTSRAGAATTLVVSSSPAAIGLDGSAKLTATVTGAGVSGTPTGMVTFSSPNGLLGSATLGGSGGKATAMLTVTGGQLLPGNDVISALYAGDSVFNGSGSTVTVGVTVPQGGHSAVVPSASPNPVFQGTPDSQGYSWFFSVTLKEMAGVATTVTGFTIDGRAQAVSSFFSNRNIPANGMISSGLRFRALTVPTTSLLVFSGADANGQAWSQQLIVSFYGPPVSSNALLTLSPAKVARNPNADPGCQWLQQVNVQETGGFGLQVTGLVAGGSDLSGQIQNIFGTTRIAPFGAVQGGLCWQGISAPQSAQLELDVQDSSGSTLKATVNPSFAGPVPGGAALSVSPGSATIPVYDSSQNGSSGVAIDLPTGSPWTASVFPANRTSSWLTVSPLSGSGPAQLRLQASGSGLANGVYNATVIVEADNASPQYVNVPVAFVVGASSNVNIGGVSNGASFQSAFAPGMVLSVFGSGLAQGTQQAGRLPLPLSMQNASATVNGVSAPLYYVSPTQLNIQIPYETGAGSAVLGVNNNGQIASYMFQVAPSGPGIFADAKINLVPFASGRRGQVLLAFITGEGDTLPALADGATPSASIALTQLPKPRFPVSVTVGGVQASVQFVGIPFGLAGVTQINFTIPANAPLGVQPVVVTVGGVPSQAVNLTVQQ